MTGPRLTAPVRALALTALMLLPACAPRQPIPSDPPDVRTESQVRESRVAVQDAALPVEQPAQTIQQAAPQPVVSKAAPKAAPKATAQPEAKAAEAKAAVAPEAAKPAPVKTEAPVAEAKAEVKAAEAKPAAQDEAAKAVLPVASAQADAAQQNAAQQALAAPRASLVQIASFNTEKNAQGALSWLREKGYAEARVVRVEQGPVVFHRVQAGPFQDLAAARKALEELKADWPQAFIPAD